MLKIQIRSYAALLPAIMWSFALNALLISEHITLQVFAILQSALHGFTLFILAAPTLASLAVGRPIARLSTQEYNHSR